MVVLVVAGDSWLITKLQGVCHWSSSTRQVHICCLLLLVLSCPEMGSVMRFVVIYQAANMHLFWKILLLALSHYILWYSIHLSSFVFFLVSILQPSAPLLRMVPQNISWPICLVSIHGLITCCFWVKLSKTFLKHAEKRRALSCRPQGWLDDACCSI